MAKNETLDAAVLGEIEPFQGLPGAVGQVVGGGGVLQKVETAYTTAVAVQKPRSLTTVVKNVLEEARLAKSAFYYKWTVKGKRVTTIQGGSIDLARSIARNFGNVAVDIIEEPESMTHFRFKAIFIDLESGLNWPRLFRQRKTMDTGMRDKERAEDIIYQIGQSKAQRNAVFQGVPGWLVDKAIEVAEDAEISGIKDEGIEFARIKVIDYFMQHGADQDRIEAKVGKPADKWTEKDIADLRAAATAIKEGRTSVAEIFPQVEEKKEPPVKGKLPEKEKGPDEKGTDETTEETKKKRGRPKGSTKKDDESPPDSGESAMWEAWRKEWINLRNFESFKEYFESHLDLIYSAPPSLIERFSQKFKKIFNVGFPVDLFSARNLISIGYVLGTGASTAENAEGDDKGEGEKGASEGNGKALSGDAIEDLLNSEIWGELQEVKNKYPSSYLRVTRGETPKTQGEVRTVIDEIMIMANQDRTGPPA
jgi:hypothetical protein